jgi:hypothetical protein
LLHFVVLKEHTSSIFSIDVRRVRILMGCRGLYGGLGQGAEESWPIIAMVGWREHIGVQSGPLGARNRQVPFSGPPQKKAGQVMETSY